MKYLILFSLILSLVISCKKDKPEEQKPQDEQPILKCIPIYGLGISDHGQSTVQFIYDSNGTVVKVMQAGNDTSNWQPYLTLYYDDQNSRIEKINDDREYGGLYEYEYNSNGSLRTSRIYSYESKEAQERTLQTINKYQNNSDGKVEEIRVHDENDFWLGKTNYRYDNNGNVLFATDSVLRENGFVFQSSREFRYDNKINPYNKIHLFYNFLFTSPNNVIYRKAQYANVNEITVTETNYNYTYNRSNLPTDVEITAFDPRFGTGSGKGFFKYNCK